MLSKLVLISLAVFCLAAMAEGESEQGVFTSAQVNDFFTKFTGKFKKVFSTSQVSAKLATFKANLEKITLHNAKVAKNPRVGATYVVNQLADLSPAEFKAQYLTLRAPKKAYAMLEGSAEADFSSDIEGALFEADADADTEGNPVVTNEKPKKKSKKEIKAEEEAKKAAEAAERKRKQEEMQRQTEEARRQQKEKTDKIIAEMEERKKQAAKEDADLAAWVPFSWVAKGVVGPVKNQGGCGSCWSYGTIATIESALAIKNGGAVPVLSEQALVSCDTSNNGCNGGWYTGAYKHVIANGLYTAATYPYEARATPCKTASMTKSPLTISSYSNEWGSDAKILAQLKKGPTAVAINADKLQFVGTGVVRALNCSTTVNHAVVAVGIENYKAPGATTTDRVWLIRNSWGTSWGDKGYYRMESTSSANADGTLNNKGDNACGIHVGAFVAVV